MLMIQIKQKFVFHGWMIAADEFQFLEQPASKKIN